ncbi:hypothetical protein MLD38_036578 [Melastoma candidum]|uniref:Uncharacterized protein n=1 Tax=Melastoma candidum TaxID=119954 RepID=A0ACB9LM01_9MYRT|nr:hypothetical protein MLD38_036578 [Melastoma candidum]
MATARRVTVGASSSARASSVSPNTLTEYSLNQFNDLYFIDIAVIEGFKVLMEFASTSGSCNRVIYCKGNISATCPAALHIPGGCKGPCPVFNTNEYCYNTGPCGPKNYSEFFKAQCPDAYSYPKDDATSVFACPGGTNYKVVSCP